MTGNNTMTLNQATMVLALQHSFDTVLFAPGKSPVVASVDASTKGSFPGSCGFDVGTSERETK